MREYKFRRKLTGFPVDILLPRIISRPQNRSGVYVQDEERGEEHLYPRIIVAKNGEIAERRKRTGAVHPVGCARSRAHFLNRLEIIIPAARGACARAADGWKSEDIRARFDLRRSGRFY